MPDGVVLKLNKAHEDVIAGVTKQAKDILDNEMPAKVLKMNEMNKKVAEDLASDKLTQPVYVPTSDTKRLKRANAEETGGDQFIYPQELKTNPKVVEYWEMLRNETIDMCEMCSTIKMWIQLNVPKIEDGNNFGVGIQEELIAELHRAEESASQVLDTATRYHAGRAKVVTKCLKYPENRDYAIAVRELDEKQLINLKICLVDLRNNYALLYDQLHKNMEKLLKPRGDASAASYMM